MPDYAVFLNLGTSKAQLNSIFYDMITLIFVLCYYAFLSTRESELETIQSESGSLRRIYEDISEDSLPKKTRGRKFFNFFKKSIYNMSHILILIFVLIFISQSFGVISSFYCLFCLIFIYKANEVIKNEES